MQELVPFDNTGLTVDEQMFLNEKEMRINTNLGVMHNAAKGIGHDLREVRDLLLHKRGRDGFEAWLEGRFPFTRRHAYNFIAIDEAFSEVEKHVSQLSDMPFRAQYQLAKAPDPPAALDEAVIRKEIEGKLTEKQAKEIAEYQRAASVAEDQARSSEVRAKAIEEQLNYVQRMLRTAQAPSPIERIVEVPPQELLTRVSNLEARIQTLSTEKARLIEEKRRVEVVRDKYEKDLRKEWGLAQQEMQQGMEGRDDRRIQANFNQLMNELKAVCTSVTIALKGFDAISFQSFGADQFNRRDEAVRMMYAILEIISMIGKEGAPQPIQRQTSFIDNTIEEGEIWSR